MSYRWYVSKSEYGSLKNSRTLHTLLLFIPPPPHTPPPQAPIPLPDLFPELWADAFKNTAESRYFRVPATSRLFTRLLE